MESEILDQLQNLPPLVQQQVLQLIQALVETQHTHSEVAELVDRHFPDRAPSSLSPKKRQAGRMKGTFVLPLAEDFDAPLDDFAEYQ